MNSLSNHHLVTFKGDSLPRANQFLDPEGFTKLAKWVPDQSLIIGSSSVNCRALSHAQRRQI